MTETEAIKWMEAFKKTYKGFPKDSETACDIAIAALKEIQQYREIGTVEECREAVEKQKAKIPFEETVEIGRNINEICSCPNCGCDLTDYKKSYWLISRNTYCYNCGQAIKWEKEDMEDE